MPLIESKDFAKYIAEAFNAEISLREKYDLACKIICKILDAKIVSLLIYNGVEDALICEGSFIDPTRLISDEIDQKLLDILKDITIFNFLSVNDHIENSVELLREYKKQYSKFEEINGFGQIKVDDFIKIYDNFTLTHSLHNQYLEIYNVDKRSIDDTSLTGKYFSTLLNQKEFDETYQIIDLDSAKFSEKSCLKSLKDKFNIDATSNNFYIGLPLYVNERYFGVIRIIREKKEKPSKTIELIQDIERNYKLAPTSIERLIFFSQLVSLHIKTEYYLTGYKKLSVLNKTISNKKINYSDTCNEITQILNCYGALIRLYDENSKNSEIRGNSKNLNGYIENISTKDDKNININILNFFEKDSNSKIDGDVLAVSFITDIHKTGEIEYFFYDKNGNLKVKKITDFEITDVEFELYEKNLINRIVIVPMKDLKKSYITFTNTANRKFTIADVEMMILTAKQVGLEIENIEIEQKNIRVDSVRTLVHQLGTPLNASVNSIKNILDDIIPEDKIKFKQIYVNQILKGALSNLQQYQTILELDTKPIKIKNIQEINIVSFLIEKSIDFQPTAKAKGINISVIKKNNQDSELILMDQLLLEQTFFALFDNAVKYSFYSSELKRKGIKFEIGNSHSDGNILIYYWIESNKVKISITNWGANISENERETIFYRFTRGENAKKFTPQGSGIGLFLAKKILDAFDAKIEVLCENEKTTFEITLKQI